MITYRELRSDDLIMFSRFCEKNQLNSKMLVSTYQNGLILLIDDVIKGYIGASLIDKDKAYVKIILIDEDIRKQGYGEGLVKAFLNMADYRMLSFVYLNCNKLLNGFLNHMKFKRDNEHWYITLPDYFNTACKYNDNFLKE